MCVLLQRESNRGGGRAGEILRSAALSAGVLAASSGFMAVSVRLCVCVCGGGGGGGGTYRCFGVRSGGTPDVAAIYQDKAHMTRCVKVHDHHCPPRVFLRLAHQLPDVGIEDPARVFLKKVCFRVHASVSVKCKDNGLSAHNVLVQVSKVAFETGWTHVRGGAQRRIPSGQQPAARSARQTLNAKK
jgi:hypothetical protein